MKKLLISFIMVLSLFFVMPVIVPALQNNYTVQATSVKLSSKKLTLNVKEKYTLKVKGTSKKVKWSTSKKKVATVSSKGVVTAKKKGSVTITAKVGSKKYQCKIKVEKPALNKTATKISLNQTETILVSGTSQKIKWSSENKSIATVNSKGKITGKKLGTTNIVAKIGNTKYKCKVKVEEPNYKSNIQLSYDRIDNDLLITIKNNNSCQIDYVGININFYKNNVLVDHIFTNEVCIPKNGVSYTTAHVPTNYENGKWNMIDFDTIELVTESASVYENSAFKYKDLKNKVTVNHNRSNDKIVGTITNNGDEKIGTLELLVFYYKDNNLVAWKNNIQFSIEDNTTRTFDIGNPWSSGTLENVDYDNYTLIVNRATK